MINLAYKLEKRDREELKKIFYDGAAKISLNECKKIDNQISDVIKLLGKSKLDWHRELGFYAEIFHENIKFILEQGALSQTTQTEKYMLSALWYLVDVEDLIPDHTLGTGYADDAFILNFCLTKLDPQTKNDMANTVKRLRGDEG